MTEENTEELKTELGECASFLTEKRIKVKALGNDKSGTEMIAIEANDLVQVAKDLKRNKKLNLLNFLTALEVKDGYQSIYRLENLGIDDETAKAVVIKVTVPKTNPQVPSLTTVFPTADWQEREAFDMIGIEYLEHPNLTRILNPDKWEGHPLRKDYIGPIDALNEPITYAHQ